MFAIRALTARHRRSRRARATRPARAGHRRSPAMHVDLTPEQKQLRQTLRRYFADLMTPEARAALEGMEGGPKYRELIRQIGKDGWLGVGWPKEYGGGGTDDDRADDLPRGAATRSGAPFPFVTVSTVGPALMELRHRSPEGGVPPAHPGGGMSFLDRIQRARRRERTSRASPRRPSATVTIGSSTARRCSRAARTTRTTSGWLRERTRMRPEAQGHLDHHRAGGHARIQRRP